MRHVRLHIVLSKGRWGRRITGAYLKALLDNETVVKLEIQVPDADILYDFILTYMMDDECDGDGLITDVWRALLYRFQPEYDSMVDVLMEID